MSFTFTWHRKKVYFLLILAFLVAYIYSLGYFAALNYEDILFEDEPVCVVGVYDSLRNVSFCAYESIYIRDLPVILDVTSRGVDIIGSN